MGYACKGVCTTHPDRIRFKGRYPDGESHSIYDGETTRRCGFCGIFFKTDSVRCPCCRIKMRLRVRKGYLRNKRIEEQLKRIE